jgi:hypothetical protein
MSDDRKLTEIDPAQLFWLHDPETVRFRLPPLPIEGLPEPLNIHLDLDMETVEQVLERLTELHARMKPAGSTARN